MICGDKTLTTPHTHIRAHTYAHTNTHARTHTHTHTSRGCYLLSTDALHAKPANSTTNKPVLLMAMMVVDGSTTTAVYRRHIDIHIAVSTGLDLVLQLACR